MLDVKTRYVVLEHSGKHSGQSTDSSLNLFGSLIFGIQYEFINAARKITIFVKSIGEGHGGVRPLNYSVTLFFITIKNNNAITISVKSDIVCDNYIYIDSSIYYGPVYI